VAVVALAGLVVSACSSPGPNVATGPTPTPRPISVSVSPIKRGDVQSTLSYSGSVTADAQVNVVPKVSGTIVKLAVDVGTPVKSGDLIAALDPTTLAAQLAQAQAGYDSAMAHLTQLNDGSRPETIAQAQANLNAAQAKLDSLKDGGRAETISQAKANLSAAQAKLASLQDGSRSEAIGQAKANLDAAQAKLAQLRAGPTPQQVAAAQLAVQQAKNALYGTQIQRDANCRYPSPLCNASNAQVDASQTGVDQAQAQLNVLTAPPTKELVDQAQAAVNAAQEQYDLARSPYTSRDLAQAQAGVDAAQAQYELAVAPYTQHDIDQAQAAVDSATQQLKIAQQPYTADDLKVAQAAVDQAKASLDLAKEQFDDANVVAPVDGVVSQRLLDVGSMTGPSVPIVTLVSSTVRVTISVEEAKLGLISVGQAASIAVPAYPSQPFDATVAVAPPTVDPKSRTAQVELRPTDTKGQLKPGMFAQVAIQSAHHSNVLVVPSSAITLLDGKSVVYVVENGSVKVQPVTTGLSDQTVTEIVSGVTEGQIVVVGDKPSLQDGEHVTPQLAGS
jgi:HlyD family secretion protein